MKRLYRQWIRRATAIGKKGVVAGKRLFGRLNTRKKVSRRSFKKNNKLKKISAKHFSVVRQAERKSKTPRAKNLQYIISQEQFSLVPLQILREDGTLVGRLPALTKEQIIELYQGMVLSRAFDDRALKLQRQGRIGTYGSVRGQEASQVGSAYALQKEDWLVPSFRENASCIVRGMPMKCLFQYWGGDERGHAYTESKTTLPIAIPISTQLPHAVGIAMGIAYKEEKNVVLAYMGDGGTSEGDFHEALNFAGVFKAPVIFLCQNNQWAISVPRTKQTAAQTLAQKAIAYGFPGMLVDGNDIFAVYHTVSEAIERAREGNGPALIECITYRMGDHTTADDASRYRDSKEVDAWRKKDPIDRLKKYLMKKKIWNEKNDAALLEECTQAVTAAVDAYENEPLPNPKDMFTSTFATKPLQLEEQQQQLIETMGKSEEVKQLKKIEGGFP